MLTMSLLEKLFDAGVEALVDRVHEEVESLTPALEAIIEDLKARGQEAKARNLEREAREKFGRNEPIVYEGVLIRKEQKK